VAYREAEICECRKNKGGERFSHTSAQEWRSQELKEHENWLYRIFSVYLLPPFF
jgi:hypothetical protein